MYAAKHSIATKDFGVETRQTISNTFPTVVLPDNELVASVRRACECVRSEVESTVVDLRYGSWTSVTEGLQRVRSEMKSSLRSKLSPSLNKSILYQPDNALL